MNGVCRIVGVVAPSDVHYEEGAVMASAVRYFPRCDAPFSDAYTSSFDLYNGCLRLEFKQKGRWPSTASPSRSATASP